jgi:uncharacterized membrane protein YgaE (UPF0421/DUF939 family)
MSRLKKLVSETSADYQFRVSVDKNRKVADIQRKLFKTIEPKERRILLKQFRKANKMADRASVRAEKAFNKELNQKYG